MSDFNRSKQIKLLVTGVGAIIGCGVIKSIHASGIPAHIIGMDVYSDAVGQHWCDEFIQAKYASEPEYIEFLRNIIHLHQIDLVFFGTEQEIYRINQNRDEMGKDIDKLVLNRAQILDLSRDKWLTRAYLVENKLEEFAIPSVIEGEFDDIAKRFGKEFLLKPRSSYACKGIVKVSDPEEFAFFKKRMGVNFMAQQIIGDIDHEYTVAVFGLGDGTNSASITLKRKLSQEGATSKAEVICDPLLQETVNRICEVLQPIGPMNLQFRFDHGRYYLLEINPRISSSTSIRTAFGYNEAEMCVHYFLLHDTIVPIVKMGRATRFIDEVVTLY